VFGCVSFGGTVDISPWKQLGIQGFATIVTIVWAIIGTSLCLGVTRLATGLRVKVETETAGLDLHQHGEVAYSFDERV
jgi:ammonium transporter, Amt family